MTAAVASQGKSKAKTPDDAAPQNGTRETIESVLVAFLLAFLFRAFVAEAFVIPTGSMAPTLMGAHKDLFCDYCGEQFQTSASQEINQETLLPSGQSFVAACCSNCRGLNKFDFRNNSNHVTFSGDRILVSKFDYVLSKPKRWDVFVFKYPQDARMNYIKRLVGLPGEMLLVSEGDVFTRTSESDAWEMARKPAHKIRAMRRVVSDSSHPAPILVDAGWPSMWQPWTGTSPDASAPNWTVNHKSDDWSASLTKSPDAQFLRYYHKVASVTDWEALLAGQPIDPPAPRESQLVTDFLAYNATKAIRTIDIYDENGNLRDEITGDVRAYDFKQDRIGRSLASGLDNRSTHWVGDLIGEFNVDVESDSGTLLLDMFEFGVRYRCEIDVSSGDVNLTASGEGVTNVFGDSNSTAGKSRLSGPGSYRVEIANVDDQIFLWVGGRLVEFETPSSFNSQAYRSGASRRPFWTAEDPLDAAPIGIGGRNLAMKVERAQVFRDIYYIAARGNVFSDFDDSRSITDSVPDASVRPYVNAYGAIQAIYSNPQWWSESNLFSLRRSREYTLGEGQYFPMGDNSAASSDARVWSGRNFVDQKYLLGKALLVFWPHTWNTPVPYTPNISRMNLIR